MISPLHIQLLGDFLLQSDDAPIITINSSRLQSLLSYLVLHSDAPQNRSRLAFLLWPDSTDAQAHTNLRQLLYHLRQSLPQAEQFLSINKQSVQWLPSRADAPWTLDVLQVEQAFKQAQQAQHDKDISTTRQAFEQVVHAYRGDLLPDCYDEWIIPERDRIRQLFLQAAERLATLLEEEHDYDAALSVARQLLHHDPLHEASYRQLMRLSSLQGEHASALRAYHTCITVMERELGTEPGEATKALYESLLSSTSQTPQIFAKSGKVGGTIPPLLGRKAEWRQLQQAWHTATAGQPHVVILTGDAGIGKTRLTEEMKIWASRQGIMTASAYCYPASETLAYAPLTTWLRTDMLQTGFSTLDPTSLKEIARLVPEVLASHPQLSSPTAMTDGWQRQFFFAALARAILNVRQPLLLLLDDLQWCDTETLEWLHYLLRFSPKARLLLIGTLHAGEISTTSLEHPLTALLHMLQRDGLLTEIPLGPLSRAETTSLAEHIVGHLLDPFQGDAFYAETEGNPLFAVEMARTAVVEKDERVHLNAEKPPSSLILTTSSLPPSVQAVLARRLAQLSPAARNLANVAAVIGREFSFPVLVRVSGEHEEKLLQGLDELWQRRMVREHNDRTANGYDFSHDKIREHVYASLSPVQRRLLHQRVAEALKAVHVENLDAVYGQIATHYEQAGLLAQAIPFYQEAGKVASRIYAHAEALRALERAAALLEALLSGQSARSMSWEVAAQVYVSLGDIRAEIGSWEDARQAYYRAMACIPVESHFWLARLHWKIATTWMSASTTSQDPCRINGRQEFEEAERILTQVVDASSSEWRDEWLALQFAQIWRGKASADDIAAAIERARPIAEQYGTQEQRKLLAEAIGMHNAIRDRYIIPAQRVAAWRASIAGLESSGDEAQRGIDLTLLGIGLLCAAQFDEAEELLRNALRLGERTGNAWVQYNCLTFLPFVLRHRGQVEELRRLLAQAQSLGIALNKHILCGHRAWVAWREDNLVLAEAYGRESVEEEQSRQIRPHPFLWAGRWPLIGVALAQEHLSAAIDEVRLLFDPTQQPPREPVDALLKAALQAWDAGQQKEAHVLLKQVVPLAKQIGYL
ncbi:BTAD domain-containing putative transcriptional regulator [Dictyobacter formicarum]|uniref:Bacterial transcriptional activator domain-containing protein n=1 Tax=Dictyobacter formicarum TaxID=2778368 RepID=A0ABQ3VP72_9CHLR|nr:BTAD domain-containing putative transcriptional regulator [Dictyobacter formicarum]GHO87484.1 hypothetical protein KSZ_54900 [Dictyobacter formicarum]